MNKNFSLVELLIVLSIVTLVSALSFSIFEKEQLKNKAVNNQVESLPQERSQKN